MNGPDPGSLGEEGREDQGPLSPRLSDLDAYRVLVRLGQTTHHLSARSWSTAAATALAAASQALRRLASALYRANIRDVPAQDELD